MHIHVFFVVEFINISEHNCNGGLARKLFNYPQIVKNSIIPVVPEFTHRYQTFHFFKSLWSKLLDSWLQPYLRPESLRPNQSDRALYIYGRKVQNVFPRRYVFFDNILPLHKLKICIFFEKSYILIKILFNCK